MVDTRPRSPDATVRHQEGGRMIVANDRRGFLNRIPPVRLVGRVREIPISTLGPIDRGAVDLGLVDANVRLLLFQDSAGHQDLSRWQQDGARVHSILTLS